MARAIANCKCEKCGETFEKIAFKYNRTEADKWQAWAEENCTICPDCWRKLQQEEDAAKAAEIIERFNLPEITGKSDKQIKYASDLRDKLLAQEESAKRLAGIVRFLNDEKCREDAAKQGMSIEEYAEKQAARAWVINGKALCIILRTGEARDIIDTLKGC